MRDALAGLNAEFEQEFGVSIRIRTGVNTGEVVAGDAGLGQRLVTGDTVNVAARLEQAAAPGDVGGCVSMWVYARVRVCGCARAGLTPRRDDFEPIELASRDEISALQLKRLKATLAHVYKNVAHYRQAFDKAGVHPDDEAEPVSEAIDRWAATGLTPARVAALTDKGVGFGCMHFGVEVPAGEAEGAARGKAVPRPVCECRPV